MSTANNYEPARLPEDLGRLFLERANAGDVEGVVALYEPHAVLVGRPPAQAVIGSAAIRAFYTELLAGGPTLTGEVRPSIKVTGLALTSTHYERTLVDQDGQTITETRATAEVARRQPDGSWRWVVDQPDVLAR